MKKMTRVSLTRELRERRGGENEGRGGQGRQVSRHRSDPDQRARGQTWLRVSGNPPGETKRKFWAHDFRKDDQDPR